MTKTAQEVWERIEIECPEFAPMQYFLRNIPLYDAVREIVLGDSVTWRGCHERFEPFPGAKVMDLGAHVGIFTAYCALKGAGVVAYEPDPKAWTLLCDMLRDTELRNRVEAYNLAVSFSKGICVFQDIRSGIQTAKCISFDDAIGDVEWDCVKVDIEGAEYGLFLGASPEQLEKIKFSYIEFHPWVTQDLYDRAIRKMEENFKFEGVCPDKEGRWQAAYLTRVPS